MREHKFRGWDKKEKRFCYAHFHPVQLSWASPKWTDQVLIRELDGDVGGVAFRNLEGWQEFTGLLDKNGKEIYEGDILKERDGIVSVRFEDGAFLFMYSEHDGFSYDWIKRHDQGFDVEVIGNIYENPEPLAQDSPNES